MSKFSFALPTYLNQNIYVIIVFCLSYTFKGYPRGYPPTQTPITLSASQIIFNYCFLFQKYILDLKVCKCICNSRIIYT